MSIHSLDRRHVLKTIGAAGAATLLAGRTTVAAAADSAAREAIVAGAKKEGSLVWYNHYSVSQAHGVLQAFQKDFPFVKKLQSVNVTAAQKTARVLQECMAGGPTTDVLLNDSSALEELGKQKFLLPVDWKALGVQVSPATTPNPEMVLVTTALYVIIYNSDRVKPADAPKNWDDLLDPKWKGRSGAWLRSPDFTALIPAWGEERVLAYVKKMAALQPRMFQGLFPLAQAVAAGEIDVGLTAFDDAVRLNEKGAPIKTVNLNPTPMNLLCGGAVKYGQNHNTAKLFLAWLATDKGALAFERMTKRGNYFVPATKTAQAFKGIHMSYYKPEDEDAHAAHLKKLEAQYSRLLEGR